MHTLTEEVALLADAAESAGQVALGYFHQRNLKQWEKSKGHAVTEADLAVNTHLETALKRARPNYGWLSEESSHAVEGRRGVRNFIVDPIDGTSAFIKGRADWCIALALEEAGEIIACAVHVPVTRNTYRAGRGIGAWRGTYKLFCSPELGGEARIISKSDEFSALDIPNKVHLKDRPYALILRLIMVAEGAAEAMLATGFKSDWDIAAGALLVTEAGGKVSTLSGSTLRFNHVQPFQYNVLAATNLCHNALLMSSDSTKTS